MLGIADQEDVLKQPIRRVINRPMCALRKSGRIVTDVARARECARQDATRWIIKEFQKALKTGPGAEKLPLETGARLKAVVALTSVAAMRLLALKEQARVDPQASAEKSGLGDEELRVLAAATERQPTATSEVVLAVGRLGRAHEP